MTLPKPKTVNVDLYIGGLSNIQNVSNPVKLSANESALGPSPKVLEIFKSGFNLKKYPDGKSSKLKETIAKKFSINEDQILIGSGSDEIISLICQSFLNKDDEVIMSEDSFLMYRIYSKIVGAKVVFAKETNFKVSVNEILKKITKKTKIVFIANPNNPTGTYLTKKEVLDLRKKLNKKILLVIDDAYAEYMKNKDYLSGLDLFKNKDNVFILRTFSKMFGLASLRVGWGYGSKKIVDALNVIKPPFNVNGIAQLAATESLKDKAFINKSIRHNLLYSEKIKKFLETYNIFSNSVSANFLLLNFEKCRYSAKFLYEKLKNKGIILRSTEDGYHIKNKLRLTIGSKKENLKFMSVIKQVLKK